MVKYPQILRDWLDLQDGARPIVIWWEPINPDETIFRVSTSFGVFIIRRFKGDIIQQKDDSWSTEG